MEKFTCSRGCCRYTTVPYKCVEYVSSGQDIHQKIKKAGGFLYSGNKILLVQSRGHLWGPPKGSIQCDEDIMNCALREIKEETGIDIDEKKITGSITVRGKAIYYIIPYDDLTELAPQTHIVDNDANGIGWFSVDCLNFLIQQQKINVSRHCEILVKKMYNILIQRFKTIDNTVVERYSAV
jgi:8-oxo-dGTP pyrophosphatase MutT (NUDIX family)